MLRAFGRATLGAVAGAAALAGCDSGPATPAPTTAVTSATTTAAAPPTPPASPTPIGRPTSCTDPAGDGGAADLTSVVVDEAADAVRVTWTVTGEMAAVAARMDNALLAVTLTRPGTGSSLLLAVSERDGAFTTPVAYGLDFPDVTVTEPARVEGATLVATYPPDVLAPFTAGWEFEASAGLRGDNVDDCPG